MSTELDGGSFGKTTVRGDLPRAVYTAGDTAREAGRLTAGQARSQGKWVIPAQPSATAAHDSSFFSRKTTDDIEGLKDQTWTVDISHASFWGRLCRCSWLTSPVTRGSCCVAVRAHWHGGCERGRWRDGRDRSPARPRTSWSWASYLTFLRVRFLIHENGKNNSPHFLASLWVF